MKFFIPPQLLAAFSFLQSDKCNDYAYRAIFIFFSLFLILPLWTITYLPLGDLPDHAGQLNVIMNFSAYANEYRINWFTPYLVGYSISLFFGIFFSATTALKITYSLAVLAVPIATASLLRNLQLNRYWVIPSFASAFSFSFYWGFFSYVVATPIAIAFFAFCVNYGRASPNIKTAMIAAIFSALLFFSHAMAWAFSILVAACIIFIYNNFKETKKKLLPFLALLPLVAYWVSINGATQSQSIESGHYIEHISSKLGNEINYIIEQFKDRSAKHEHTQRAKELLSFSIGRMPLLDFVALALILIFWPALIGARLTRNWRRWLPPLCAVGAFMVVPYWIFDTAYVNLRFAAFLIPLSLFLFEANKTQSPIEQYGSISFAARFLLGLTITYILLAGNYRTIASFKSNDDDFKTILSKMEPNKIVLALMFDQDSALTFAPPYMHYGSYYQAEKGGVVIASFSHDPVAHNVPLRYKGTPWPIPDTWSPSKFDWQQHNGNRYDYFLVRSKTLRDNLFSAVTGKVSLEAKQGDWLLYKNDKSF